MFVERPDRDVSFLPNYGMLPGSSIVRVWVQSLVTVVHKLVESFNRDDLYSHCTDEITPAGRRVDVGFSAYADDTRKLVVQSNRMELIRKEHNYSEILDKGLADVRFAQNISNRSNS